MGSMRRRLDLSAALQLHQACESVAVILIVAGILLFIDGVGSILIRFGQKHSLLFELERSARTILAILITIIGLHFHRRVV